MKTSHQNEIIPPIKLAVIRRRRLPFPCQIVELRVIVAGQPMSRPLLPPGFPRTLPSGSCPSWIRPDALYRGRCSTVHGNKRPRHHRHANGQHIRSAGVCAGHASDTGNEWRGGEGGGVGGWQTGRSWMDPSAVT